MNNNNLKKYSKTINTTHFTQNLFFGGPQILKMFIYICKYKTEIPESLMFMFWWQQLEEIFQIVLRQRQYWKNFFQDTTHTLICLYWNRQYTIQNSSDWSKNNSIFFCKRTNLVFNNLIIINHGERYSNKWLNIG